LGAGLALLTLLALLALRTGRAGLALRRVRGGGRGDGVVHVGRLDRPGRRRVGGEVDLEAVLAVAGVEPVDPLAVLRGVHRLGADLQDVLLADVERPAARVLAEVDLAAAARDPLAL